MLRPWASYKGLRSVTSSPHPKVCIGLPVYNGQRYLARALDSLLGQTFTDFEVVVSDNASIDSTPDICRAYADKDTRVRYVRNEVNIGIAGNFNRVFELSRSPYFKWAACDDLVAPEFLARCVEVLDNDTFVGTVVSKERIIDEDGKELDFHATHEQYIAELGDRYRPVPEPQRLLSRKPHERFDDMVRRKVSFHETYGVIRSDVLARTALHGSYPGSDRVLVAELALLGGIYEIPEKLLFSRVSFDARSPDVAMKMDPSWKGSIYFPELKVVGGYLRAVRSAPLKPGEKARCVATVLRKIAEPDNLAKLLLPGKRNYLRVIFSRRSRG